VKLRFIPDSGNGAVFLLHEADPNGATALLRAAEGLAGGRTDAVAIHLLPGIQGR
jgi:hypothetical protein